MVWTRLRGVCAQTERAQHHRSRNSGFMAIRPNPGCRSDFAVSPISRHPNGGFSLVRIDYVESVCEPIGTGIMRIHFHYVARLDPTCFVRWNTDRSVECFRREIPLAGVQVPHFCYCDLHRALVARSRCKINWSGYIPCQASFLEDSSFKFVLTARVAEYDESGDCSKCERQPCFTVSLPLW
jgi:hypothetical protein